MRIIAFILFIMGAIINYGASLIEKRLNLAGKMEVKEAQELSGEELEKYKKTKAIARIKMIGAFIFLPGAIMLVFSFR